LALGEIEGFQQQSPDTLHWQKEKGLLSINPRDQGRAAQRKSVL